MTNSTPVAQSLPPAYIPPPAEYTNSGVKKAGASSDTNSSASISSPPNPPVYFAQPPPLVSQMPVASAIPMYPNASFPPPAAPNQLPPAPGFEGSSSPPSSLLYIPMAPNTGQSGESGSGAGPSYDELAARFAALRK